MSYEGNKRAEQLDRIATRLTGGQALGGRAGPKLVIVAALILLALTLMGIYLASKGQEIGQGLSFASAMAALAMKLTGEYRARGNGPLDERERAIYWKANAIGAIVPLFAAAIWSLNLGQARHLGFWQPRADFEWTAVTFFLLGLMMEINLIVTGWLTPSYAAALDPDD